MRSRCPHRSATGLALAAILLTAAAPATLAAESTTAAFLGKPAPAFELPDSKGEARCLADFRGENGTVILWVSTKCPVSNAYNSRMAALAGKSDLMAWGYRGHPDTNEGHCRTAYFERFAEHGITLWGATAYKGAEGHDSDVPDIPLHTENATACACVTRPCIRILPGMAMLVCV